MSIVNWISENARWLFSGIGVVILGSLWHWFMKPRKKDREATPSNSHTVTSYNQSGGITAHSVNVHEVRRALSSGNNAVPELVRFSTISAFLHRYSELPEVSNFTTNILQMLRNSGWKVNESVLHIGDSSIVNVVIEINAATVADDNSANAAAALVKILNDQGIAVQTRSLTDNRLPKNSMYLRIGPIT